MAKKKSQLTKIKEIELEEESDSEKQVYLPGMPIEEGQQLEPDMSAYKLLTEFHLEWPSLSFDFYSKSDMKCGGISVSIATGTQSASGEDSLCIVHLGGLEEKEEEEEDSEEDEAGNFSLKKQYRLDRIVRCPSVNRVRCSGQLVAAWHSDGSLCVYDVERERGDRRVMKEQMQSEGFALAWNQSKLVAGDCMGNIRLFSESGESTMNFKFASTSIEDLQWSPSDESVFASSGTDGYMRMLDQRSKDPISETKFSSADLNVISWNRNCPFLMASGDDAGVMAVWDLRNLSLPVASFEWHRGAITSVEWHPIEQAVLGCSGADDQISFWDLSLEAEEPSDSGESVPPQLLFVHQGQKDIKEIHFSREHFGLVVSTSLDGFNIFKPINL